MKKCCLRQSEQYILTNEKSNRRFQGFLNKVFKGTEAVHNG